MRTRIHSNPAILFTLALLAALAAPLAAREPDECFIDAHDARTEIFAYIDSYYNVSAQQSTSRIFARDLAALASMLPGSRWSGRPPGGF